MTVFSVMKGKGQFSTIRPDIFYQLYLLLVSALPGIEFGDNQAEKYLTDQNGAATVISEV